LERDGHASERTFYDRLDPIIEAGDVWLTDRNFCTKALLQTIHDKQAFFVIRQHGTYVGHARKEPEFVGKCSTGSVYSQEWYPTNPGMKEPKVVYRRITIKLDAPILTNLPSQSTEGQLRAVNAVEAAELYSERWTIENGFRDMATVLQTEPKTMAHPESALFLFCVGLLGMNVARVTESIVEDVLGPVAQKLSLFFIVLEIRSYAKTFEFVDDREWELCRADRAKFIAYLRELASRIDPKKYPKRIHERKPGPEGSSPPKKKRTHKNGSHRSTARELDKAKGKTAEAKRKKAHEQDEKPNDASKYQNT
jgi:hypothetical protein